MINGNTFELIGRCNYLDLKTLDNGKTYTRICVSKKGRDENYLSFWVTFFGDSSEEVAGSIQKGDYIHVTGKLDVDKYTNKEGKNIENLKLIGFTAERVTYDTDKKEFVVITPSEKPAKKGGEAKQEELPWQ